MKIVMKIAMRFPILDNWKNLVVYTCHRIKIGSRYNFRYNFSLRNRAPGEVLFYWTQNLKMTGWSEESFHFHKSSSALPPRPKVMLKYGASQHFQLQLAVLWHLVHLLCKQPN